MKNKETWYDSQWEKYPATENWKTALSLANDPKLWNVRTYRYTISMGTHLTAPTQHKQQLPCYQYKNQEMKQDCKWDNHLPEWEHWWKNFNMFRTLWWDHFTELCWCFKIWIKWKWRYKQQVVRMPWGISNIGTL